jgi:large subunit ribosomal protein L10e
MALRKGSAYSKRYARPYTRNSKKRAKSYIKTIPNSRIVKFKMGDIKGFDNRKYPIVLEIKSKENCQVRDNSIEAIRQFFNRFIQKKLGKEFYLEVKVYPHHILRENKMLTGAGADRMQTGMSRAFGKTMGRAALVKVNQTLFVIGIKTFKQEVDARKLISSIKARIPCKLKIEKTVLDKE